MTRDDIIQGLQMTFNEVGHDLFEDDDEVMTGRDLQDIIPDIWISRSDDNRAAFDSIVNRHYDENKGWDEWRSIKEEAFPASYKYCR